MLHQKLDVNYLLEYEPDASFVGACYQTLLERTVNPGELRYSIQMLNNGLSRKGFLYWICHSPEFGNRYSIKDLGKYRIACYLYKGFEKLRKALHLERIEAITPDLIPPQTTNSIFGFYTPDLPSDSFDFETEFSALSCGQISLIPSSLCKETSHKRWTISGHLASEIISAETEFCTVTHEELSNNIGICVDNVLITSPKSIFQLLADPNLCSLGRYIKDTFIFTMPVLPSASNKLSAIWDCSWGGYETINDIDSRWLKGRFNQGSITLINHSSDYKKVSCSFLLMCPCPGACIQMKCGDSLREFSMKETVCSITLDLWLNPGYNKISFHYSGSHYVPTGDWARAAKFAIANLNLSISNCTDSLLYGLEAYELSEDELGTGYYPYLLPDSFLRSQLHRNGFFQVSAYNVSSTYAVNQLMSTRYHYPRDERDRNCYYIFEDGDSLTDVDKFSSLNIYIAHRTSPLMRENFHFCKDIQG